MKLVHMILQGKGGVGKSTVAAFLAQQRSEENKVLCLNVDPMNPTICSFEKLNTRNIELMEGRNIDKKKFDLLIEEIIGSNAPEIIIDGGSSSFISYMAYMIQNDVIEVLADNGVTVVLHVIVTGGQQLLDTVAGLDKICNDFSESGVKVIVWLNEFWGPVELDGKVFGQMIVYRKHKELIKDVITLEQLDAELFAKDVAAMLKANQTFDEAMESVPLMEKHRLKKVKTGLFLDIKKAIDQIQSLQAEQA